jgi:hypothetical protein
LGKTGRKNTPFSRGFCDFGNFPVFSIFLWTFPGGEPILTPDVRSKKHKNKKDTTMTLTIEKTGRRYYLLGNTYPVKDTIRDAVCRLGVSRFSRRSHRPAEG